MLARTQERSFMKILILSTTGMDGYLDARLLRASADVSFLLRRVHTHLAVRATQVAAG
jgi:hypothetical protein